MLIYNILVVGSFWLPVPDEESLCDSCPGEDPFLELRLFNFYGN